MQEQKKSDERQGPAPSQAKPEGDEGPVSQAPASEPFFDSGLREEKPPRSGEEHGGAADAGRRARARRKPIMLQRNEPP